MRIMIDTNVFISAFILSSHHLIKMIDAIAERHTIVLSTYVIDELKKVTKKKFPNKINLLDSFLQELPFELVYTPDKIDKTKFPDIRDLKDLPILVTAILENVDVLISGDTDFTSIEINHPEILTPKMFVDKYC